jgi:hypothetical protein
MHTPTGTYRALLGLLATITMLGIPQVVLACNTCTTTDYTHYYCDTPGTLHPCRGAPFHIYCSDCQPQQRVATAPALAVTLDGSSSHLTVQGAKRVGNRVAEQGAQVNSSQTRVTRDVCDGVVTSRHYSTAAELDLKRQSSLIAL